MIYYKNIYLFIFLISFISCEKKDIKVLKTESTNVDSSTVQNQKTIRAIGETLSPAAKLKVQNWTEYQQLDQLLEKFYSSSPIEALNLSKELSSSTKQLKDSIKIERFKQPDIGIRINVLHNNALRLADMATIPSIKAKEVQDETQNILDAFSALNSKINNLTKQEKIELELKDFETN
ncbi:MAG TPA: hypothetical protein DEO36_07240 [Flavobacteriaceae bacterium]|nr:hypothetical protein [Flavobacteriaceae bacterium]